MESYSVPFRIDLAPPQGVMATLQTEKCFFKNERMVFVITYRTCVTFSEKEVEAQAKLSQLVTELRLMSTFARKERRGLRAPKYVVWVLL